MTASDDDLLRPTLSKGLDVGAFRDPWNPGSLMWIAFFGLVFGGGLLFAENARRLGRPDERQRILIGTIVITLATSVAVGIWLASSGVPTQEGSPVRRWRLAVIAVALVLGAWLKRRQMPLFEAYQNAGRKPGRLWPMGLLAVVLGLAVHIGLSALVYAIAKAGAP